MRTRSRHGGPLLLILAGAIVLSGCMGQHRSNDVAARPTAAPTTISPYALLDDPSSYAKIDEMPLAGGMGQRDKQFTLAKLGASATHLIVRWTCSGSGTFQYLLDGVVYSSSPCARDVVYSANLPLKGMKHPRLLTLQAPAGIYWRISITQLGGQSS